MPKGMFKVKFKEQEKFYVTEVRKMSYTYL